MEKSFCVRTGFTSDGMDDAVHPVQCLCQTWEAESTSTNIVAVVDCSTSMQSSDSDWKIPESLDMLVDMCDDEQVRLSLIVYGTSAETAFRDFPLSAENHEW